MTVPEAARGSRAVEGMMGTREMTQQTDQAYGHDVGQSHYDYSARKGQQEQSDVAARHSHNSIQCSQWIASWIGEVGRQAVRPGERVRRELASRRDREND